MLDVACVHLYFRTASRMVLSPPPLKFEVEIIIMVVIYHLIFLFGEAFEFFNRLTKIDGSLFHILKCSTFVMLKDSKLSRGLR